MITRLLVNTSGSAKRKTNEVWFLSSAIHPATRIFSNLSHMSRTSASAVHRPHTVPVPICLGNLQWGSTWAGRRASAAGSQLVRSYNCLFRSKAIIPRLPSPNSCQLSQKLWKCNIVGISASSSDWIEIDPRVSKLLGGGGAGEAVGQAAQVIALILTGEKKKKTHPKLEELSREVLNLGVNVRYWNRVICSWAPWQGWELTGSAEGWESWVLSTLQSQMIWIQVL